MSGVKRLARRVVHRLRQVELTPRQYFLVACAAMGTLVLIVFTGAAVRVTGSGLGCPDWPNCYEDGRLTPELDVGVRAELGREAPLLVAVGPVRAAEPRAGDAHGGPGEDDQHERAHGEARHEEVLLGRELDASEALAHGRRPFWQSFGVAASAQDLLC